MNTRNALIFALFGSVMEILPAIFPSWFPRNCADQASARALWLGFMGEVQIALGAGYILQAQLLAILARSAALAPAGKSGSLALPAARGAAGR